MLERRVALAHWIALAGIVFLPGCPRAHEIEGDAGVFEPCTIPVGSAELSLGDRPLSMRSYAFVQEASVMFAAYVDGTDIYLGPDPEDGCGLGWSWSSYRDPTDLPPYDVFMASEQLPVECSDVSIRQRVERHTICETDECARFQVIECDGESCADLPLESGMLDAFIEGDAARPTFCARIDARSDDGRELTIELNAELNGCLDCAF